MKSLFIVNPRSGIRRRGDVRAVIQRGCEGWVTEFDVTTCKSKDDLDALIARALSERFEVVYAVGGDGTVHEVAKRLIGTATALGIIPTGSGNGLARHLGIPLSATAALSSCRQGTIATIDTAVVNGMPWIGVMGVGFDALVANRFAVSGVRGMRTYVQMGLREFIAFRAEEYEIEVDGKSERRRALIVAVANSSQYGNNARIAPLASLQDGFLDVVAIEELGLYAAPLMLVRLFNGTVHRARGVRVMQGQQVTIRRERPGPAHVDGEPVTLPAELDISVRPQSLRVLLPAARSRI